MHDRLFSNQKALREKDLQGYAGALDLDLQKFAQCLSSGKHAAEIRADSAEGVKAGIRGTPTFLVGLTEQDSSKVKVTKIIRGAQPYSRFKQIIDSLLASQKE
jgi:predicted DsbA family dithiol-disulfide isomerase